MSLEQAQADVTRVAAGIAARDPERHPFYTGEVIPLREQTAPALRATLLILLAGAGLLLLIACANVATLLLARSVVRARETAIRVALGASRRQLALRYIAEGALVSLAGAAAGVGLSAIFVRQILAAASAFVPLADRITIDWKVFAFSAAVAIVTGVLAGVAPLWQALHTPPNAVLSEGARASAAAPARRLSKAFVVAEIALAFTLLALSATLIVHLRSLGRVPLGYDADGVVTFQIVLPQDVIRSDAWRAEQERLIDAVRRTPGVTNASFANQLPTVGPGGGTAIYLDDRAPDRAAPRASLVLTTPEFHSTLRIPLRAGRLLSEFDSQAGDELTVVVNDAAARTFWPGRSPIGAAARLSQADGPRFTVVGLVDDVRNVGLSRPTEPELYLAAPLLRVNPMEVVVRSDLPADQVIAAVRGTLRQAGPTLAMTGVRTMRDAIGDTLQLERLSSLVMTLFGVAALLMATLGVYGVVSYFVRQRTMELGTRMALGAVNRNLVVLVLIGGLKLALAGVAVGAVALVGGIWLIVRFLGVADFGWLPAAFSTVVVALVGGAAASVPAWRTTFLSPMAAIREQPPSVWRAARQRMQRTVRDVLQAVGVDDGGSAISPADVLTAFVDAARSADSYTDALRAVLASVCDELRVESAALLERRDGTPADYRCLVATGTLAAAAPALGADGFLISRLQRHPRPLPFAPNELAALRAGAPRLPTSPRPRSRSCPPGARSSACSRT